MQYEGATTKGANVVGEMVRRPRIIHIDDEQMMVELVGTIIQQAFPSMTLLAFRNRDTAWQELQRADPDLLITDMNNHNIPGRPEYMGMSGWELLPLLAKREVKYPILVVSGGLAMPGIESQARQLAGPKLDTTFLTKPFSPGSFLQEVVRLLSQGDDSE